MCVSVIGIAYTCDMSERAGLAELTENQSERVAFGEAMQAALTMRGVHQTTLAKHLGTSQSVVSQWRHGQYTCPPPVVFAIEDFLRLPPGYLSRHMGYCPTSAVTDPPLVGTEDAILLDAELADAQKSALMGLVQTMKDQQRETLKATGRKRRRATSA